MGDYIATVHLYSYGAWDDAVAEHNYAFEHEPLVTTFEATKEEVRHACSGSRTPRTPYP